MEKSQKLREMIGHNGHIVIDPIYVKPKTKASIIVPSTNRPSIQKGNYDDHPFKGLVIASSKFFYNGGFRYETEVNTGDVVLMSFSVKPIGEMIEDGIAYPVVRFSDIYRSYTPTAEEVKAMIFERQMENDKR